jgi:hypothetical protein
MSLFPLLLAPTESMLLSLPDYPKKSRKKMGRKENDEKAEENGREKR